MYKQQLSKDYSIIGCHVSVIAPQMTGDTQCNTYQLLMSCSSSIQQPHPHAAKCEEEGADIPFIEGLYHNAIAGDPFSDFLQRYKT